MEKTQKCLYLDIELINQITEISKQENRSFSNLASILMRRGMKQPRTSKVEESSEELRPI